MRRFWFRAGLVVLAMAVALSVAQAAEPAPKAKAKTKVKAKAPAKKTAASKKGAKVEESAAVKAARKLGTPTKNTVHKTASGLEYIDVKEGKGAPAKAGGNVAVHYTGWLVEGKKFDSSKDRGRPFEFPLGAHRVIKGWDEGVAGMKPGGVRKLIIPSNLGYGPRGAGGAIPPNATLVFEVEYLGKR